MGVKKVLKAGFISSLNPKKIIGLDSLKQQTSLLGSIFKTAFGRKNKDAYQPESFQDAMDHYNVSEEALEKRMRNSLYTVYFCLSLSLITLSYSFYQFSVPSFVGGLMCIVLTILLWSMAFREHFNLFQMRQRRLGCSFKEWFQSLFKK